MGQLIDLCGTPIQLEKVKHFRLIKRECLFYPAYQEVENQMFSLFARRGEKDKKKFVFNQMVPFGIVLNDKEKPSPGSYEFKAFDEVVAASILDGLGRAFSNAAGLAADLLRIDTSGNKEFRILTQGRRVTNVKLRDIPAKVAFLSGKVSDVYKNDSYYPYLGEPIAPTIVPVPTLVVSMEKTNYVFFGGGIDIENPEVVYQSLLEAYNNLHSADKAEKAHFSLPKFNMSMPKLNMPSIKFQSPFVFKKDESAKLEASENQQEASFADEDE